VQLAGPVVVKYLGEDARMSVEEIFVEYRVVVGQRLGQTRQPSGRDLLQRGFVCLVSDAAHVENDSVLGVRHGDVVGQLRVRRYLTATCLHVIIVVGVGARNPQSAGDGCQPSQRPPLAR